MQRHNPHTSLSIPQRRLKQHPSFQRGWSRQPVSQHHPSKLTRPWHEFVTGNRKTCQRPNTVIRVKIVENRKPCIHRRCPPLHRRFNIPQGERTTHQSRYPIVIFRGRNGSIIILCKSRESFDLFSIPKNQRNVVVFLVGRIFTHMPTRFQTAVYCCFHRNNIKRFQRFDNNSFTLSGQNWRTTLTAKMTKHPIIEYFINSFFHHNPLLVIPLCGEPIPSTPHTVTFTLDRSSVGEWPPYPQRYPGGVGAIRFIASP